MTRTAVLASILCLLLIIAVAGGAQARDRFHPYHHGPGPWRGEPCRGPAYGWLGPGTGYGYGYWNGYGYGWWEYIPDRSSFGSTLSSGEAKKLIQWVIRFNPNLQVGDVAEVEGGYEVTIITRQGKKPVDTVFIEKDTAYFYPVYPPGE